MNIAMDPAEIFKSIAFEKQPNVEEVKAKKSTRIENILKVYILNEGSVLLWSPITHRCGSNLAQITFNVCNQRHTNLSIQYLLIRLSV